MWEAQCERRVQATTHEGRVDAFLRIERVHAHREWRARIVETDGERPAVARLQLDFGASGEATTALERVGIEPGVSHADRALEWA